MQPPSDTATLTDSVTDQSLDDGEYDNHGQANTKMLPFEFALAVVMHNIGDELQTVQQAKSFPNWPQWEEALKCELTQHESLGTWKLVEPSPHANVIGSCWVFHYKIDSTSKIVKYKGRLVTQCFSQAEGINYNETFSPTAKLSAIRIIAALATCNDWELKQTDIDGAYLNAPLTETIYMHQPMGFEIPGKEGHICHLQLAIYGLKQASREWYELFCKTLGNIGFSRCQVEHTVFYRHDKDDYVIMAVEIDDLSIAGNTRLAIAKFKQQLYAK